MSEWYKFSEKLPEDRQAVWVYLSVNDCLDLGFYLKEENAIHFGYQEAILPCTEKWLGLGWKCWTPAIIPEKPSKLEGN